MKSEKVIPIKGPNLLANRFRGVGLIDAWRELLKNAVDWSATHIHIHTTDRSRFVIVDDGVGMNEKNRVAFCSVGATTASGGQSGKFDTGSKRMLYAFSIRVTVRTVSRETPDEVHIFTIEADTYESMLDAAEPINVKVVKKTATTWPYDFTSGTELTYELREPGSRAILRGKPLAVKLSAQLPIIFQDILRVDGQKLPPKQVQGEIYAVDRIIPRLGEVSIDLYRPVTRGSGDGLHIGSGMISDVSFGAFAALLAMSDFKVPPIFMHPRVCGVISADFLKRHGREDRQGFDVGLLDDPLLVILLAYLEEIAEAVEKTLGLTEGSNKLGGSDQVRQRLLTIANRTYPNAQPAVGAGHDRVVPALTDQRPSSSDLRVFRLLVERPEFEVGEKILIHAAFARDFGDKYSSTNLRWNTDGALGKNQRATSDGIELVAAKAGKGSVTAQIAKTQHSAAVDYVVVQKGERRFRLSPSSVTVPVGDQVRIKVINPDKVVRKLDWSPGSSLEVSDDGTSATFTGRSEGTAVVKVMDGSGMVSECSVVVTPAQHDEQSLLCIRGLFFRVIVQQMDGPPVEILVGDRARNIHMLYINPAAPGYAEAEAGGVLEVLLLRAVAEAYGAFDKFNLQGRDRGDITAAREAGIDSWKVLAELLQHLTK